MIRRILATCCVLVTVLVCGTASAKADDLKLIELPLPVELQPYRVSITVAFGNDPLLTTRFRRRMRDELVTSIQRTYGQMWQLVPSSDESLIGENRQLSPQGERGLKRLTAENVGQQFTAFGCDKAYLLSVELTGSLYRISGCEWDAMSQQLGPVKLRTTHERRAVTSLAMLLLREIFQPVVTIEEAENGTVLVRLRAGELSTTDPTAASLRPGSLLQPVFRYSNRKGELQQIQTLPWTYLQVERVMRSHAICTLKSGLRAPLGQARRRVAAMAIGISPASDSTKLALTPISNSQSPLVGYRVSVNVLLPKPADGEKVAAIPPLRLFSDRNGIVTIPANSAHPLVWLSIHSGDTRLALVPFVPGLKPSATIQLPDDSIRLNVEGRIAMLQSELIDTVARRAVLMTYARQFSRQEKWQAASEKLAELDELPSIKFYRSKLTAIRYPAVEAAQRQNNRIAELRIEKLCKSTSELISHYLDETKILDLEHEIEELRSLQNQPEKKRAIFK